MADNPINSLMDTTMVNLKQMVDVNTIVGDPVESPDGSVIIPISRVSFGFVAGGGEYESKGEKMEEKTSLPFAGGSGAGISVNPVAFMVVGQGQIRLLPITQNPMLDRFLDITPQLLDRLQTLIENIKKNNHEGKELK
ncbi:MAG: GerW family sporulation protein [Thermoanaerobacteraceae bacterium]|nr:GerW family sporulation protein [Thermoanaerobacteraceae bacterium]